MCNKGVHLLVIRISVFSKNFKQFKSLRKLYDLKNDFNQMPAEFRRPPLQQLTEHSSERQSFRTKVGEENKAQIFGPLNFV